MAAVRIHFEQTEQGYNLSINDSETTLLTSRDDTWNTIYNAVKYIDFTTQAVEFNGMPVPSMDRLVLLVKYML